MSVDSVKLSNRLILCCSFLLWPSLSQQWGLFQWVSSSHQVARVIELQLQHQSFKWMFRVDFLVRECANYIFFFAAGHWIQPPEDPRSGQHILGWGCKYRQWSLEGPRPATHWVQHTHLCNICTDLKGPGRNWTLGQKWKPSESASPRNKYVGRDGSLTDSSWSEHNSVQLLADINSCRHKGDPLGS